MEAPGIEQQSTRAIQDEHAKSSVTSEAGDPEKPPAPGDPAADLTAHQRRAASCTDIDLEAADVELDEFEQVVRVLAPPLSRSSAPDAP